MTVIHKNVKITGHLEAAKSSTWYVYLPPKNVRSNFRIFENFPFFEKIEKSSLFHAHMCVAQNMVCKCKFCFFVSDKGKESMFPSNLLTILNRQNYLKIIKLRRNEVL